MFADIECPKPAYDRLIRSGVVERILEKPTREAIDHILLYSNPYDEGPGELALEFAERGFPTINPFGKIDLDLTRMYRDILDFFQNFNEEGSCILNRFEELLLEHPSFLAHVVLTGIDRETFLKFGFPTRRSLEEAITSFCLGEDHLIRRWGRDYCWRQGNFKNRISLNEHGDLYASQTDVSGEDRIEETLLGPIEIFDTFKKIDRESKVGAINVYQDWSQFLTVTLKYAEAIGQARMPELVNWKEHLERFGGGVGTCTAEAEFGIGGSDIIVQDLKETPILTEGKKPESLPLSIYSGRDSTFLPYIANRNLTYLQEDKNGETIPELEGTRLEDTRFSRRIEYVPEDLPHVLGATYKFFARDRSLLPKIMDMFSRVTQEQP